MIKKTVLLIFIGLVFTTTTFSETVFEALEGRWMLWLIELSSEENSYEQLNEFWMGNYEFKADGSGVWKYHNNEEEEIRWYLMLAQQPRLPDELIIKHPDRNFIYDIRFLDDENIFALNTNDNSDYVPGEGAKFQDIYLFTRKYWDTSLFRIF